MDSWDQALWRWFKWMFVIVVALFVAAALHTGLFDFVLSSAPGLFD